jgi:hypothetical protein
MSLPETWHELLKKLEEIRLELEDLAVRARRSDVTTVVNVDDASAELLERGDPKTDATILAALRRRNKVPSLSPVAQELASLREFIDREVDELTERMDGHSERLEELEERVADLDDPTRPRVLPERSADPEAVPIRVQPRIDAATPQTPADGLTDRRKEQRRQLPAMPAFKLGRTDRRSLTAIGRRIKNRRGKQRRVPPASAKFKLGRFDRRSLTQPHGRRRGDLVGFVKTQDGFPYRTGPRPSWVERMYGIGQDASTLIIANTYRISRAIYEELGQPLPYVDAVEDGCRPTDRQRRAIAVAVIRRLRLEQAEAARRATQNFGFGGPLQLKGRSVVVGEARNEFGPSVKPVVKTEPEIEPDVPVTLRRSLEARA